MKKITLILGVLVIGLMSKAQTIDSVTLLNGRIIYGDVIEIDSNFVFYEKYTKNYIKRKKIDATNVFSICYKDSAEVVIYDTLPEHGIGLAVIDMRTYIYGQQDAMKNYKAPWTTVTGFGAGLAGGLFVNLYGAGILAPTTYTFLVNTKKINIKTSQSLHPELIENTYYQQGFKNKAKAKRLNNAIIGGIAGIIVTATIMNYNSLK